MASYFDGHDEFVKDRTGCVYLWGKALVL